MLIAQQEEIAQFVSALFRYAEEGSVVGLRSFTHDKADDLPRLQGWPVVRGDLSGLIEAATREATRAANASVPLVFCPPVATFQPGPNPRAREVDLANGVAISVELDRGDTKAHQARLVHLLGPVTIAVASGGQWVDPETGELHDKLHLHWRLSEPTRTHDEHRRLKHARDLAALLVGADMTAVPLVHPLRWPGSWHLKDKPKLAMIAAGNPAAEVHLEDVIPRLEEAVEAAGVRASDDGSPHVPGVAQSPIARLTPAVMAIPNPDTTDWERWNKIGLCIHHATGGSDEGKNLWHEWSAKSAVYVEAECDARWAHYHEHGFDRMGAGTLYFLAKQAGYRFPTRDQDPPPDHTADPGYLASLGDTVAEEATRDYSMSAGQWEGIAARETGYTIPATQEATEAAGKVLWEIAGPWEEASIPRRPWVAVGYLMRRAITVLSGPGSAGKSLLMVAWACALAIGCNFGRFRVAGPLRVMTYNVEDDEDEQKRRFSAMLGLMRLTPASLEGRLLIIGPNSVGTLLVPGGRDGMLVNTPVMDRIKARIAEFKPDVLMLDPFVELHTAEENDNTAVRAVIAAFRAMASTKDGPGMSIVLAHHARKGAGTPGDPDSLRGASSIVGAARVALTLNVMTDEEAKSFNIQPDRRRDYFRLDSAKSNYARIEDAEWFQRQERHLANGDGVPAAWPYKPVTAIQTLTTRQCNEALDAIAAGRDGVPFSPTKAGRNSKGWVGRVLMDMFNMNDEQTKTIVAGWMKSGLLYTAEWYDKAEGRERDGVKVDNSKRPT